VDLHPFIVHFAIVIPIIALILQVTALFKRSKALSKNALNMLFFGALALVGAWFTGGQQGPEVYPFLSEEGQQLLLQHRNIGIGIGIGFALLTALKMFSFKTDNRVLEIVVTVVLLFGVIANLSQGKSGGQLVYEYGAGVECPEDDEDDE
jgi:uncharacterized membrane protein